MRMNAMIRIESFGIVNVFDGFQNWEVCCVIGETER